MAKEDRQADLYYTERQTDPDGYLCRDHENRTCVDGKRSIRSYPLEGKALFEYGTNNKYDMREAFSPERADRVELDFKSGDPAGSPLLKLRTAESWRGACLPARECAILFRNRHFGSST